MLALQQRITKHKSINFNNMKKIYLTLMCATGLLMLVACGSKGSDKENPEKENAEAVEESSETAEAEEAAADADVWSDPAKVEELDLNALYASGDFKTGTTVIFEDDQHKETAGQIPSQWDVKSGTAEVGEAEGGKYISASGGDCHLFPLVNNGSNAYLPEKFAAEFQFLFGKEAWYHVYLFDSEENEVANITFTPTLIEWNAAKTDDNWIHGDLDELDKVFSKTKWNHFGLTFDNGNLKIFLNGKRVTNLGNIKSCGHLMINCTESDGKSHFIKNIKISK
jgi:predicted small lipoprotein YifL